MMRLTQRLLFVMSVLAIVSSSLAQTRIARRIEGDGGFHLKEVQSILTSAKDTVKILTVLPADLRAAGYADIDLKENDEILMLNGKRLKTVQQFEKAYNDLEIGAMVKMGIRRDGQLMIESFKKIDPENLPRGGTVMIRMDTDGPETEGDGPGMMTRAFSIGGEEGMRPLFGTGLILNSDGDKVKVSDILEEMTSALGGADIKKNDLLTSINGQKIKSIDQFFEIYDKLENETEVKLEYSRENKKMNLTFAKPNVQGRMRMRVDNPEN